MGGYHNSSLTLTTHSPSFSFSFYRKNSSRVKHWTMLKNTMYIVQKSPPSKKVTLKTRF